MQTPIDKEVMAIFNGYQREMGISSGYEAPALLTLAHILKDLRKTFVVTYEGGEKNIATAVDQSGNRRQE